MIVNSLRMNYWGYSSLIFGLSSESLSSLFRVMPSWVHQTDKSWRTFSCESSCRATGLEGKRTQCQAKQEKQEVKQHVVWRFVFHQERKQDNQSSCETLHGYHHWLVMPDVMNSKRVVPNSCNEGSQRWYPICSTWWSVPTSSSTSQDPSYAIVSQNFPCTWLCLDDRKVWKVSWPFILERVTAPITTWGTHHPLYGKNCIEIPMLSGVSLDSSPFRDRG